MAVTLKQGLVTQWWRVSPIETVVGLVIAVRGDDRMQVQATRLTADRVDAAVYRHDLPAQRVGDHVEEVQLDRLAKINPLEWHPRGISTQYLLRQVRQGFSPCVGLAVYGTNGAFASSVSLTGNHGDSGLEVGDWSTGNGLVRWCQARYAQNAA